MLLKMRILREFNVRNSSHYVDKVIKYVNLTLIFIKQFFLLYMRLEN